MAKGEKRSEGEKNLSEIAMTTITFEATRNNMLVLTKYYINNL